MNELKLTEEQARDVYDILVRCCGAYNGSDDWNQFIYHQTTGCQEYRFQGKLGFGGKFWNGPSGWFVTCYSEDLTPARQTMLDETNEALKELRKEYDSV